MGLPEVEVSPVYFITGLTLGQCRVPEGGQCHQCGAEEEGTQDGSAEAGWLILKSSFPGELSPATGPYYSLALSKHFQE